MKQNHLSQMNKFHTIFLIILTSILLFSCSSQYKSGRSSATNYDSLIQQQRFTFVAQSVIPTEDSRYNPRLMFPNGSNLYQLSSGYDLKVTPDTITAYLPFYGRAYTAPMDPSKGGIQFTTTKFDYKRTMRKQNYEITITPKDAQDVRTVYITVSPSGYASVNILSQNRTPISYNGIIEPNPVSVDSK